MCVQTHLIVPNKTVNSLISCADPEGATGGPDPPEKSQKYRVSYQYWSRYPEKSQSYQASIQCWVIMSTPAKRHLNDVSSADRWWPDLSGIWILFLLIKKRCQSSTPSDKTFWICVWGYILCYIVFIMNIEAKHWVNYCLIQSV